jgi:hypothetical protein
MEFGILNVIQKITHVVETFAVSVGNEFEGIEKIVVYEADKSSGRREQTVDFYFTFIGKIELPGQEVKEPFDPEEHRKAQWRAHYYRHREKILADKAEERAADKAAKLAAAPTQTPEEIAAEEEAKRERKRAYQREYQREWQRKRREEQAQKTA